MTVIETLLVDDNPEFIEAAKRFLSADKHLNIVSTALSAQEAIDLVENIRPDLVLMDLAMPEMNGLEATERIKSLPNPPCVIILTLHDTPEYREASHEVGADGFITKSDFGAELLPLIQDLFEEVESAVPAS